MPWITFPACNPPDKTTGWGTPGGNERPIEDLSTAAVSLDMGVEQQGLGVGGSGARSLANRSPAPCARRAQVGPARTRRSAPGVSSPWNCSSSCGNRGADGRDLGRRLALTNSADRRHERRQARAASCAARSSVDVARARRVEDEADRVGARLDRRVDVGLARQAADLDAGALVHRRSAPVERLRAASPSPASASGMAWTAS